MSLYKGSQLISGAIPNSANQSLSNLDSAGQDKFDAKVNKSGDTMTGDLTIRPDSSPHIYLQNSNFTKGTNPSSNIYWEYRAEDSNTNPAEWYTNRVGNFVTTVFTDGTVETAMFAYQNNQNANTAASIYTRITQAGVASCTFPNTTCCDGQWVGLYQEAIGGTAQTINAQANKVITFTALPAKRCEIMFTISQLTTDVELAVWSNLFNGNSNRALKKGCATIILPVDSDKIVKIGNLSSTITASISLVRLIAYRIIGTNSNN